MQHSLFCSRQWSFRPREEKPIERWLLEFQLQPTKKQTLQQTFGRHKLDGAIGQNHKEKVRQITTRSHNLDAEMVEKLNRVIRGTANYFTRPWSACCHMYRTLDRWIRMRLR